MLARDHVEGTVAEPEDVAVTVWLVTLTLQELHEVA
jgi:hypothetical protein